MQKKSKIYGLPVAFVFVLTMMLNSCGVGLIVRGVVKKSVSVEKETVPEGFIRKDQTLLIMMWQNDQYDRYAKKAFDKFYSGKKKYVTFGDLKENEEYQDLELYPYVFSQGPSDIKLYEEDSFSFSFSGSRPFHIFDRANKKFYTARVKSGFFYRLMQGYAMKLNEIKK